MANAVEDKKRSGRSDLKALADLAGPPPPPSRRPPPVPASADSSGFVDLAAFSADDPHWVERELAKVRTYADEGQLAAGGPTSRGKVLTPGSLAPLALTALVEKTDDVPVGVRKRKLGAIVVGIAAVCLSIVAVGVVKRSRDVQNEKRAAAAQIAPAPVVPPTQAAPVIPPPAPTVAAPVATTAQASNDPPADAPKANPKASDTKKKDAKKKSFAAGGAAPRPQAAPARAQAAAKAPASKAPPASGGGGSLLDLMKASVAGGAKKK